MHDFRIIIDVRAERREEVRNMSHRIMSMSGIPELWDVEILDMGEAED